MMGKTRLGFDIGSSSMKVAVWQGGAVRLEEVPLPENLVDSGGIALPHAFARFLRQAKKDLRLPRGAAALVLPPSQVICRLVTMPRMTTEQLLMNLPYEFTDFIQGVADQYYCDYALCEPAGEEEEEGLTMMAAAAAKQALAEYARLFSQAGLRLRTVLPQEMALIQLCQARGAGEFCFVDLGHQNTRITVVWRDRVQATRQIALGGRNLDLAVADELGVDAFLSNTYKTANFQNVLALPAVAEVCERIAVEILREPCCPARRGTRPPAYSPRERPWEGYDEQTKSGLSGQALHEPLLQAGPNHQARHRRAVHSLRADLPAGPWQGDGV